MVETMIFNLYDRFLWSMGITLSFICSLLYFNKGKKNENMDEKLIIYGYSVFFISISLIFLWIYLSELLIPGTYVNHTYFGDYEKAGTDWKLFIMIGQCIPLIGLILYFFAFERIFKRTRYLFTIFILMSLILINILPFDLSHYYMYNIIFPIVLLIFFIILILYTKWAPLEIKAVSAFILFGMVLIAMSMVLIYKEVRKLNIIPLTIPPIFFIMGTVLCLIPTIINQKSLSTIMEHLKIIGGLVIGVLCITEIFYIFLAVPIILIITNIIFILVSIILLYNIFQSTTSETPLKALEHILTVFTKPEKLTEEEVSISKEKKICLVCKGKVARDNIFLCPECDTFYCLKCSKALANLENACWVCETPFDESKPVKLSEKKEGEISVVDKIKDERK